MTPNEEYIRGDTRGAGSGSRSERGVLDGETMRVRRIRGNDCRQESTGGGHSARTQVRRGKAPNLGHRDLVPKAGLARGYDPLKETDRFASTDLPAQANRSLLLSGRVPG